MNKKLGLCLALGSLVLLLIAACSSANSSVLPVLSSTPSPSIPAATVVPTIVSSTGTPKPTETPAPTSTSLPTIVPPAGSNFIQCKNAMKARVHIPDGTSVDQLEDVIAKQCYERETDWKTGVWGHIVSQTEDIPADTAGNPIPYAFEPNSPCDVTEPYLCEGFELWVPKQVYDIELQPEPPFIVPESVGVDSFRYACTIDFSNRGIRVVDDNPQFSEVVCSAPLTVENEASLEILMPWVHACYQELAVLAGRSDPALTNSYGSRKLSAESAVFSHLYGQQSDSGEPGAYYGNDSVIIRPGTYDLYLVTDKILDLPSEPVAIGEFTAAEVVGVGEHGAMLELSYDGDQNDLRLIPVIGTIFQNNQKMEKQTLEIIDDRLLIEMTDAMYELGAIDVKLTIPSGVNSNKPIKLSAQYEQRHPFMRWLFGEHGLDKDVGGGFTVHHMQWDLAFSSNDYPNSVGTPIHAPAHLQVMNYTTSVPGRDGLITNENAYFEDVGLIFNFGHIDHERHPIVEESFLPGTIIAYIDENQSGSSRPHTHMGLNTTEIPPDSPYTYGENNFWINPFSQDPYADGSSLPTGLWLPETVPQDVIDLFDEGFFSANTYVTDYIPGRSYYR